MRMYYIMADQPHEAQPGWRPASRTRAFWHASTQYVLMPPITGLQQYEHLVRQSDCWHQLAGSNLH